MKVFKGVVTTLPPDKSISHRAALIGALAKGTTEITNFSGGYDNQSTLEVLQACGIRLRQELDTLPGGGTVRRVCMESDGFWSLSCPAAPLMCNNSGSTMRMMAGILAAQPFESVLVGDESLMKRPMRRIQDPLTLMGADVSLSPTNTAPVTIRGTRELKPVTYELPVPSAQVKSLVAFAALHADGESRVIESLPSRNHTELMLGLHTEELPDGRRAVIVPGRQEIAARPFYVPGDPSAACFLIALGLLVKGSEIVLKDVCLNPTRAGYIALLLDAGAAIMFENERTVGGEAIGDIIVSWTDSIQPIRISDKRVVADIIDEIPMLAVFSACATGEFELHHAEELRTKESDRISAVVANLEQCGFRCEEYPDGFRVVARASQPSGSVKIECFHDHRIAMSFAIAAEALDMDMALSDAEVIGVSFPNFFDLIRGLEA
ncbi:MULTISPECIES: 3-phosphoshikimate 1-carboxyvinyltransferase [Prosthecochloris]|uniref:3-phosphoshikimate 1-carboxyvinyltransferase n=1 Tax=Prosthecochloris vibrioformis TaxID=1098 RepID=A0A5C4S3V6_PROVB|nr:MULTISPECIES: 3-phosphoshikimate 1-carboxyvinyltransferase [Prosthecochloris]ANT65748.1 3-phosphoshikimate 1-carboxyvinyltransferase [Prosthecochloris sp. CIB 2401]TNJ37878.1 3-phosphoshikimate 1-carboxyvinyltransferase [Prosthecochloris vibrioformis]